MQSGGFRLKLNEIWNPDLQIELTPRPSVQKPYGKVANFLVTFSVFFGRLEEHEKFVAKAAFGCKFSLDQNLFNLCAF